MISHAGVNMYASDFSIYFSVIVFYFKKLIPDYFRPIEQTIQTVHDGAETLISIYPPLSLSAKEISEGRPVAVWR